MQDIEDAFIELEFRLYKAQRELEKLRNQAARNHALDRHSFLAGKIEGVELSLSYVRDSKWDALQAKKDQ